MSKSDHLTGKNSQYQLHSLSDLREVQTDGTGVIVVFPDHTHLLFFLWP